MGILSSTLCSPSSKAVIPLKNTSLQIWNSENHSIKNRLAGTASAKSCRKISRADSKGAVFRQKTVRRPALAESAPILPKNWWFHFEYCIFRVIIHGTCLKCNWIYEHENYNIGIKMPCYECKVILCTVLYMLISSTYDTHEERSHSTGLGEHMYKYLTVPRICSK